jgi:hypothetical protein
MYYHMLSLVILRKCCYSLRHGKAAVESRRSPKVKVNEEPSCFSYFPLNKTPHHCRLSLVPSENIPLFGLFRILATPLSQ